MRQIYSHLFDEHLVVRPVVVRDGLFDVAFEVLVISIATECQVASLGADAQREARRFKEVFGVHDVKDVRHDLRR